MDQHIVKTEKECLAYIQAEIDRIMKIYTDDKDGWMNGKYPNEVRRFNYAFLRINDIYEALQDPDPWKHDEIFK